MTIDSIDVTATLSRVEKLLAEDKDMSSSTRSLLEVLVLIISLLVGRLNLNSRNSSKPPASDPNRERKKRAAGTVKPGGQKGHVGKTLEKVIEPDFVKVIKIDRRTLPAGVYKEIGYETRQVFDIQISKVVTEYQAQVLENENGKRFTAPFPDEVAKAVQYGNTVKAHSVYMSQFQLIPYDRIADHFADQLGLPISTGSIFNFNTEAYHLLEKFEDFVKNKLATAAIAHADETGAMVDKIRMWLHCFSNEQWTYLFPHKKRGTEAMDDIGILPRFKGILCHDHWKPYFTYKCIHSLCNSHHIRELTGAWEQDGQKWAQKMLELLEAINKEVNDAGGVLNEAAAKKNLRKYRDILKAAEIECPAPDEERKAGKRGRLAKSKSRNLLQRLRDYEAEVLRFMDNEIVPFTNNLGENDIRMTKVQQKISGCFRSYDGAKIFCRIRSYLSTCRKQGISSSIALELLFSGKLPDFVD